MTDEAPVDQICNRMATEVHILRTRIAALLKACGIEVRCKRCNELIFILHHRRAHDFVAYTADGAAHPCERMTTEEEPSGGKYQHR